MILPDTSNRLLAAGYNAELLEASAARAFTHAQSASVNTIQQFWAHFVAANRLLYPRGDQRQEAA